MKHHLMSRYRIKYFLTGALFTILLSASLGFATKYSSDEKELKRIKQEQTRSRDVRRVQAFYLRENPRLWESLAGEMAAATVEAATMYRIPLEIQVGVNVSESDAHPFAESSTGAKGLGQVDFAAWSEELGKGNPFEPRYNQQGTSYVLSRCIRKYGLKKGLQVYNVGEGSFQRGKRNRKYVSRVYEAASEFRYFSEGVR